ncbi:uncharacterized protein LOC119337728 [Triticum dicoccoides]|uniref:uncharacterized protein LOC119337728 n=1 Tax=Triticum dicoccoides TaxID=85692 RepID=UPI00188F3107|nr:uncharacterized protein LOC119337728 [Triticum dicoccoides]
MGSWRPRQAQRRPVARRRRPTRASCERREAGKAEQRPGLSAGDHRWWTVGGSPGRGGAIARPTPNGQTNGQQSELLHAVADGGGMLPKGLSCLISTVQGNQWELMLHPNQEATLYLGALGVVVKLLPCDHEVTGSTPTNSLLQKCRE